jgi:hypothetical protein
MFLKWTTEVRLDSSNDARNGYLGSFFFLTFSDINEVIREVCLNSRQKVYIVYFSTLTNHVLCENMWLYRNLLNICYCYLLKDMLKIVIFGFIQRYQFHVHANLDELICWNYSYSCKVIFLSPVYIQSLFICNHGGMQVKALACSTSNSLT